MKQLIQNMYDGNFRPLSFLILIMISFACINAITAYAENNAVQALEKLQTHADLAFDREHYDLAMRLYLELNKVGDKFSAYRIANMYERGLGVKENRIAAYAWSYLAAETGSRVFLNYHQQIKQKLDNDALLSARTLAGDLIRNYGMFTNAVHAKQTLRSVLFQCAGSRVGNTCNKVSVTWLGCSTASDRLPSTDCLRFGSLGLVSYTVMPTTIRAVQKGLNEFIDQYNPGRVELGDFDLIGDPEEAPANH